jgi:hypothetical protein
MEQVLFDHCRRTLRAAAATVRDRGHKACCPPMRGSEVTIVTRAFSRFE